MKKSFLIQGAVAVALACGVAGCRSTARGGLGMELMGDRDGTLPPPVTAVVPSHKVEPVSPVPQETRKSADDDMSMPKVDVSGPVFEPVDGGKNESNGASAQKTQEGKGKKSAKTHKVRKGETLSGIARKYSVSVEELCEKNQLKNRNRLLVGQVLQLPENCKVAAGTEPEGAKKSSAVRVIPMEIPADGVYVVQQDDSLSVIAKRFGLSLKSLKEMNPELQEPYRLSVGQKLRVKDNAIIPAAAVKKTPVMDAPVTPVEESAPVEGPVVDVTPVEEAPLAIPANPDAAPAEELPELPTVVPAN